MDDVAETSARLLRLLGLLQARPTWTAPELAERLEVTTRTVRRDVTRLRDLGYPVDAEPGPHGGYRLGRGGSLPPLLLDDDEAVAVALGLRLAADGSVAGIDDATLSALAKLEQVLPPPAGRAGPLRPRGHPRAPGTGARPRRRRRPGGAGGRVPPGRPAPPRLPRPRGPGDRAAGRSAPPGALRAPLVPGGARRRPRRLAHPAGRPGGGGAQHRAAGRDRRPPIRWRWWRGEWRWTPTRCRHASAWPSTRRGRRPSCPAPSASTTPTAPTPPWWRSVGGRSRTWPAGCAAWGRTWRCWRPTLSVRRSRQRAARLAEAHRRDLSPRG